MKAEGLFKTKPKPKPVEPEPVIESPKKQEPAITLDKDSPDQMDFSPTSGGLTDMQRLHSSVKKEERKQHDREEKK